MKDKSDIKLSRRDFLKIAGIASAAVVAKPVIDIAQKYSPIAEEVWHESAPMITGRVSDLELITSEIPEQLKGVDIPKVNEYFQRADNVFLAGLTLYEEWREKDNSLPGPYYKKPENYIDALAMATQASEEIQNTRNNSPYEGVLFFYDLLLDTTREFDRPYSAFFDGSAATISSLQHMIQVDPGTGFVKELKSSMKIQFGKDFDIWSACNAELLTNEQKKFMADRFSKWYFNAMDFIQFNRKKSSEPLSSCILFAYFLHKNEGDILASTWDTSTWLKIICRNDPLNDLKRDPTYERAFLACSLFKDEFSPKVSANWVVDNVSPNDNVLNDTEDWRANCQWKDYMPPNRAGGFYHAWNIMALSMCISPPLAKRAVAIECNPDLHDDGIRWTEYGRVKSMADMLVVDRADEIDKIANRYA